MMTMTCPKYCHFFYDGMNASSQLALIRHNYNLHKEQARTKAGYMRWRIVFPKVKKQWVAKKIYTTSSNQYILDLMALVDEMFDKSSSLRSSATSLYEKEKKEKCHEILLQHHVQEEMRLSKLISPISCTKIFLQPVLLKVN